MNGTPSNWIPLTRFALFERVAFESGETEKLEAPHIRNVYLCPYIDKYQNLFSIWKILSLQQSEPDQFHNFWIENETNMNELSVISCLI